jgi:hypothetical protein
VTVQKNPDSSLNVRLIDFDGSDEIREQENGKFGVKLTGYTLWCHSNLKPDATSNRITNLVGSNVNLIMKFFKLKKTPTPKPLFNIPNWIGAQLGAPGGRERGLVGSPDYLHIIDLCSWSYTISLVLSVHERRIRELEYGLFAYNILLVVVMNILLPNHHIPDDPPVDCFGRLINKEYCDKVVNGLSALSRLLSDSFVPNEAYTHSKANLFVHLIQECSSSDELIGRFKAILQRYPTDYDEFDIMDDAKTSEKFAMVQRHITEAVAASGGAGGGGIRITMRNIRKVRKMRKLRTLRKIRRTRTMKKRRTHHKKARM